MCVCVRVWWGAANYLSGAVKRGNPGDLSATRVAITRKVNFDAPAPEGRGTDRKGTTFLCRRARQRATYVSFASRETVAELYRVYSQKAKTDGIHRRRTIKAEASPRGLWKRRAARYIAEWRDKVLDNLEF